MIDLEKRLRHVPNFPKAGIDFIDITTVLQDAESFQALIEQMADLVKDLDFDVIVGAESRGFIMGAPLAFAMKKGFVPIRKPGKLPYHTYEVDYALEYGHDTLAMHTDAVKEGQKVLIVDDLLATGGTASANIELVEKAGGIAVGLLFFIELVELNGRKRIPENYPIYTLVKTSEHEL